MPMSESDENRINNANREAFRMSCELIRKQVPATEIGRLFGLNPDHSGRCRCPFHNGHDRNMKLYVEDRGFYCFVCHESGDCIALAKQLIGNNCTYAEAARWIDSTFRLGAFSTRPTWRQRVRRAEVYARMRRNRNET